MDSQRIKEKRASLIRFILVPVNSGVNKMEEKFGKFKYNIYLCKWNKFNVKYTFI